MSDSQESVIPQPRLDAENMQEDAWADTSPHPWRRFLARMTDYLVVGQYSSFIIFY